MPIIKPVSDLRNYNEVLNNCGNGEPVFLTKNGHGRYVILDINDYEKQQATIKLCNQCGFFGIHIFITPLLCFFITSTMF